MGEMMNFEAFTRRMITEAVKRPSNFELGAFWRSVLTNMVSGHPDEKTEAGVLARELLEAVKTGK